MRTRLHGYYLSPGEGGEGGGEPAEKAIPVEDAIKTLEGSDYMIFTPSSFKEKEAKIRKDEAINSRGQTHEVYDNFFKDLSGLDRDADNDEKTVDYGRRVVSEMIKKAQGKPNEQIEALNSQLSDTKQKFNEMQGVMEKQKEEYESKLFQKDISQEFNKGLMGVSSKLGYQTDSEKEVALAGFERLFYERHQIDKDESGGMVVTDLSTGRVLQDEKLNNLSPAQAVQVFAQKMLKFSNGSPGGGGGTKPPSSSGMPPISNMVELDNYLDGIFKERVGSEEWEAERTRLKKELAL